MSGAYKLNLTPLSKNPLIDAASEIAETVYGLLSEFPESEKWDTAARLHQGANYLLNNVARAVGNSSPTGAEFDWGNARKEAFSVYTMLRFASKQGFLAKNPELLIKMDALTKQIDEQIKLAQKRREEYDRYELSSWEDKYAMWQKLNSEIGK